MGNAGLLSSAVSGPGASACRVGGLLRGSGLYLKLMLKLQTVEPYLSTKGYQRKGVSRVTFRIKIPPLVIRVARSSENRNTDPHVPTSSAYSHRAPVRHANATKAS